MMAKRKRLTPARADMVDTLPGGLETKSMAFPGTAPQVPIAQVAGDAASAAALKELADEVKRARDEGRMIQALPLDSVDAGYLQRDRITPRTEELDELIASIRDRGQQAPIEVVPCGEDRYGLISGWRRLTALRQLRHETGGTGFSTVLAVLRHPDRAADAYVAMVEENEIRLGLSYYERARIAAKAVEQGVFETEKQALQSLFSTASRAKRSKIKSFLALYHAADPLLRFPAAIPERLGIALSRVLEDRADHAQRLRDRLAQAAPRQAEAELDILQQALASFTEKEAQTPALETHSDPTPAEIDPPPSGADHALQDRAEQIVGDGIALRFAAQEIALTGRGVTEAFRRRLVAWIAAGAP